MISKFEQLPNEVLINIMEYISSPIDIYQAFAGLNQRFDLILQFLPLSIDVSQEDKKTLILIHYFSAHCHRLRVFCNCPSMILIRFSRLHSLTMIEPTELQINTIQSTALPMLEYLASPASLIIFQCLFGDEQQRWHCLHSCEFFFSPLPPILKPTWKPNSNLYKLSGINCSRGMLSQLLALVPSLKYLRVELPFNDFSNWSKPVMVENLVSLGIIFFRLTYDDLSYLIGPQLSRLYLQVQDNIIPIDFGYLAALLISLPQKLKQFNCDYQGKNLDINAIRNAHLLFKNMEIVHSYSFDTVKIVCKNMKQSQ